MKSVTSLPWPTAVALAAVLAAVAFASTGASDRWELPLGDALLRLAPRRPAEKVAAIVFDEASLTALGPWPVSRTILATIVDRVRASGASGVVLDLLLVESRPGDDELASSLAAVPSILVAALNDTGEHWILPAPLLRRAADLAHPEFQLDHDGVVRRFVSTKQANGLSLPAVSVAVAGMLHPHRPVPTGKILRPDFRVRAADVPVESAARLLSGDRIDLSDRVVFIGVTAAGLGDWVMTPVSAGQRPEPGVLAHAAIAATVAGGGVIRSLPPLGSGLIAAFLAAAALRLSRLGGAARIVAAIGLLLGPFLLGSILALVLGLQLPIATLSAVVVITMLAVEARLALVTYRGTGTAVRMLAGPISGNGDGGSSPEARLILLERAATEIARWREEEIQSRRIAAHELKTPLTSLRGLGQLLTEFELSPEETRRVAAMVHHESSRLQAMVEALLELERTPLRDFEAESSFLDLAALVRERCELLVSGSRENLRCSTPSTASIRGDRDTLTQMVDNLLTNAVKFSPAGSIVEVALTHRADSVVLTVRDHGDGVPEEEREAIFSRFTRGRASAGTTGLGLGLSLVDVVVRWHRGSIAVADAPGGGAVFEVAFTAAPEPKA